MHLVPAFCVNKTGIGTQKLMTSSDYLTSYLKVQIKKTQTTHYLPKITKQQFKRFVTNLPKLKYYSF